MPLTPNLIEKIEKFKQTLPDDIGIMVYDKRMFSDDAMLQLELKLQDILPIDGTKRLVVTVEEYTTKCYLCKQHSTHIRMIPLVKDPDVLVPVCYDCGDKPTKWIDVAKQ